MGWLLDEFARAKARSALVPPHARPVVVRKGGPMAEELELMVGELVGEHYITAMGENRGWFLLACRCGWLGSMLTGAPTAWEAHLKGQEGA